MSAQIADRACIVGIGQSAFGKRGTLTEVGVLALVIEAIKSAAADAGLDVSDIDGFASFAYDETPPSDLSHALPIGAWRHASMAWGGMGSALPTAVANAAMAVVSGEANYVVVLRGIVQGRERLGGSWANGLPGGGTDMARGAPYTLPFGFNIPPALYALRARRHMAVYGTTSEQLAHVAITAREHAASNPHAIFRTPLTLEEHQKSRMIADPLRMFDCCLESDGAAAMIITTAERAVDLKQRPVYIGGVSTMRQPGWTTPVAFTEDDELLATSGHKAAAADLYGRTGLSPTDVDVGLLYDGTTIGMLLVLEDWGLCDRGEGGSFVAAGETKVSSGRVPVNPHGGNLAEVYLQGITHLIEGVRQLRGSSSNQVSGAEVALYASGVGYPPAGGVVLHR